jgi:hypothetical protein
VDRLQHLLPNGQAHGWVRQLAARLQRGRAQPHQQHAHLHALRDPRNILAAAGWAAQGGMVDTAAWATGGTIEMMEHFMLWGTRYTGGAAASCCGMALFVRSASGRKVSRTRVRPSTSACMSHLRLSFHEHMCMPSADSGQHACIHLPHLAAVCARLAVAGVQRLCKCRHLRLVLW